MKTKTRSYLKILLIIFVDLLITFGSCMISYALFVELDKNVLFDSKFATYILITMGLTILFYSLFRLYNSLWRYASVTEFTKLVLANVSIVLVNLVIESIVRAAGGTLASFRIILVTACFMTVLATVERFVYRLIRHHRTGFGLFYPNKKNMENKEKVLVVGAGDAGVALIHEMINAPEIKMYPVCIVDDDLSKVGKFIESVKIVGTRDNIKEACKKYEVEKIVIAMPSVPAKELSKIIQICQETGCKIQTVPGFYQLLNESVSVRNLRNVEIKDLLGREQILVNLEEINGYLNNQVVLVSGGGGSIGSELCRQIAQSNPKQLIIVDIYENNAYDIEQELKRNYPELNLLVLIASVRDKNKLDDIFNKYKPNIVFHAAAHKHVPLMETSPNEAVKNNVFGTLNMAQISDKYNVKRFILISTDKAVNPTSVMGATKRICEMIIQTINKHSKTEFVAVRFGNVLGSNGSVIPLFKKQIEKGGPVTVTDERITRFFMTIPEAVSLVLQAGSYAKGGEIFVLDMGEPVKIYDLATNLIRLSGYTPNVDMKIEIVGLRPGEKLYEEILMDEEGLQETPNKLIHIGKPIELDEDKLFEKLDNLYKVAYEETTTMRKYIKDLVPTFIGKED